MNALMNDLRYAVRQLRRAPGFALTAVLTLALSIGATVTIYSVVRTVLLAPLPYPEQARLVGVAFTFPQEKPNNEQAGSGADFVAEHSRCFESIGVLWDGTSAENLSINDADNAHASPIAVQKVSAGYFPTLGVRALLGRTITAEDDLPGGPRVAVLSHGLWVRDFNHDAGILNHVVHLNGESYTVIGVMPASFNAVGESAQGKSSAIDLWQPLQLSPKDPGYEGDNYKMIARLRPGVSLLQAQQEAGALKQAFYQKFPYDLKWKTKSGAVHEFRVWPLKETMVSNVRSSLLALGAAVVSVLLIASLNLAGLMTARNSQRMKEIAVRRAIGASRSSILRLLMCESILLATAGGVLGALLAHGMIPALLAASPLPLPQMGESAPMWLLMSFALLIACGTTLSFGLIPALTVFRQDENRALYGGQSVGASASQAQLGRLLIVGQVAIATILLTAASLLLGSFVKLQSIPSGVRTRQLAIAQVNLQGPAYAETLHTRQFIEKVIGRLSVSPGVEQVAAVNGLPLDRGLNMGGRPADSSDIQQTIEFRAITPGYFHTLGIPLMRGRDISETDSSAAQRVVLVSEAAARKWWPGRSPIGEQVVVGGGSEGRRTVVGVVADTHSHSLTEPPRVVIYGPFAQLSDEFTKIINGWFPTTFAIRLSGDVDIAAAVRQATTDADAAIPVARFTMMQTVVNDTLAGPEFFSWLASGFAGFALLLTLIGLFGLLSYQVTQRTREMGLRIAVGADQGRILMLIMRGGLLLTGIGLLIGSAVSLAMPKLVGSLLADTIFIGDQAIAAVLPNTTISLLLGAVTMIGVAALASYLPARRAASTDPMQALRTE